MSLSQTSLPSRVFARDQPTDSNGCVVCDSNTTTSCPECASDEQCQLTTQTCSQCAQFYCVKKDSSSSSSSSGPPIGGIVGGVIGGLAVLALVGMYLYYRLIYRKKHPLSLDDEDMAMSDYDYDYDYDDQDTSSGNIDQKKSDVHSTTTSNAPASGGLNNSTSTNTMSNLVNSTSTVGLGDKSDSATITSTGGVTATPASGDPAAVAVAAASNGESTAPIERPPGQRRLNSGGTSGSGNKNKSNRRLSSYESFTRPKARYHNGRARVNNSVAGRKIGNNSYYPSQRANQRARNVKRKASPSMAMTQRSQQNDYANSDRNSIATTISTTNASNILPIAYIPGVTVRPTRNNTRLVYSYESDSIFSDLNTIENASIIGDVMRANNHNGVDNPPQDGNPTGSTTTAIKAQPRLVNVDRIEEEEEDEDLTDGDDDEHEEGEVDIGEDDGLEPQKKLSFIRALYANSDTLINGSSADNSHSQSNTNTFNNSNTFSVGKDEEESEDSDVDSDIGEINRATSINRSNGRSLQEREVLIDNDNYDIPLDILEASQPRLTDTVGLGDGSFILDVEFDSPPSNGSKSPFDDPPE